MSRKRKLLKNFSKLAPGEKEQYTRDAAQGEHPAKLTNLPTAGMQAAGMRAPSGEDPYPQKPQSQPQQASLATRLEAVRGASGRSTGDYGPPASAPVKTAPAADYSKMKKPVGLEIGPAKVMAAPKPVGLDIGPAKVTPLPKPRMIAQKAEPQTADEQFRAMTEKLQRRAKTSGRRTKVNPTFGKALQVMSIDDYYDAVVKAAPPAPTPGAALPKPKKFPRQMKPMVKMKPVSDGEAAANLKTGKSYKKSLVMLAAIKALATGYGKVGGGVLRAANRGSLSLFDLNAAKAVPDGGYVASKNPLAGKASRVPARGVVRAAKKRAAGPWYQQPALTGRGDGIARKTTAKACDACDADSMSKPTLKKQKNVVHKSEGDATMSKTNFNDLFKSELGIANDDVLIDCPHCEAPITKSDLSKASSSVAKQNAASNTMRGGDGRGQVTSSRPGAGVPKSDPPVGVQNSKGSRTRKSEDDDSSSDADSAPSKPMKKGMSIRGTEVVQYIDYGDAPGSDSQIAKSIMEAQGALGQEATQPMDPNSDLSRLLV